MRERCVGILSFILKHKGDRKDRREAASRLGQIPCPSAERALEEAANDIRIPVKEQVAKSLREIKTALSKKAGTEKKNPGELPQAEDH